MSKNTKSIRSKEYADPHISYSQFKLAHDCPYKHFLVYREGHKTPSSVYMDYGTAIHEAVQTFFDREEGEELVPLDQRLNEVLSLYPTTEEADKRAFLRGGPRATKRLIEKLQQLFSKGYELVETELLLWTPIKEGFFFKGFIDFLLKKDDKHYIIDLKTTNRGWYYVKFNDQSVLSQLRLYKHFYGQQTGHPVDKVFTYYLFGKRDVKKEPVEFKKIESGKKSMDMALESLLLTIDDIDSDDRTKAKDARYFQLKSSPCRFCEFWDTELCP